MSRQLYAKPAIKNRGPRPVVALAIGRSRRARIVKGSFRIQPGKRLRLSARRSSDHEQDKIMAPLWSFGDGKTAKGQIVQHAYSRAGTYQIKLTLMDEAGAQTIAKYRVVAKGGGKKKRGKRKKGSGSAGPVVLVVLLGGGLLALGGVWFFRWRKP